MVFLGVWGVVPAWAAPQAVNQDLLKIQICNAKKLYQKNKGNQAVRLMKRLVRSHPRDAEANYILALLLYKVKKDKRGMEKFLAIAQRFNSSYQSPLNLSEAELNRLLTPRCEENTNDLNLKIQLEEIEKYIQWGYWDKVQTLFLRAADFVPGATLYYRNRYYLNGLVLYDHLGDKLRVIHFYRLIDPDVLPPDKEPVYQRLQRKWRNEAEKFERKYRKPSLVTEKLDQLFQEKKYEDVLLFISLVDDYFRGDEQFSSLLNIYRLEVLLQLKHLREARALSDSLAWILTSPQLPRNYAFRLNQLNKKLLLLETGTRIARDKRKADSLMLRGYYSEGMAYYHRFLSQQQEMNGSPDFIYYLLSSIHMKIGQYDEARKFLKKINIQQFSEEQVNALRDSIGKAEEFEAHWRQEMSQIQTLLQNGQVEDARAHMVPLLASPFLRYGLKDSSYTTLARIYLREGKYIWAKEMLTLAQKYSSEKKQFLWGQINHEYVYYKTYRTHEKNWHQVYFYIGYTKPVEYTIFPMTQKKLMLDVAEENLYFVANALQPIKLKTRGTYLITPALEKSLSHLYTGAGFVVGWGLFFLAR